MTPTPAAGFSRLLESLEGLGIAYLAGGSLASSIHGIPRTTLDIDLVADIRPNQAQPLADVLGPEFYCDADLVARALETGRAFNIIHIASGYKFDLFPLTADPFLRSEFDRRRVEATSLFGVPLRLPVAAPEDTILAKLAWYEAGNRISEHQWNDVLGVLAVQKSALDLAYLRRWALHLRVGELLEQAMRESGAAG